MSLETKVKELVQEVKIQNKLRNIFLSMGKPNIKAQVKLLKIYVI